MPAEKDLIEMGRLGKALGLKGELYLVWHGEALPEEGQSLYLSQSDKQPAKLVIHSLRVHKERLVVSFKGIKNRNLAEELVGKPVFQLRSHLSQPGEEEVFLTDLLGARVLLADGTVLGTLDHVEFPAGQQIWSIRGTAGNEILFPAQACFIESLDPDSHTVIIAPPPGLLDIYNA